MKISHQLLRTLIAWTILAAWMSVSSPTAMPVVFLIVPFILLYAAIYALWLTVGLIRQRYSAKETVSLHRRLGMVTSGAMVMLLVLQSLGQLTVRDVVTLLAILLLGYLYFSRTQFSLNKR